jgi:hypothetical protein
VSDEVDTHQRLAARPLRRQRPVGVIQELYALQIAHDTIRGLLHKAAVQAGVDPDRLSFVHALRVRQDAILEFQITASADRPRLSAWLLRDIAAGRLPARWPRSNSRVVKCKMSKFCLKRPAHAHPPRPSVRAFREAVVICADGLQHEHAAWLFDQSEPFYQQMLDIHQREKCLS